MEDSPRSCLKLFIIVLFWCLASAHRVHDYDKHPLSKIDIYKTTVALSDSVSLKANPLILGLKVPLIKYPLS